MTLAAARAALVTHDWPQAYELLTAADAEDALTAEDLEGLADASWWLGRLDDCISARQRAYELYAAAGDTPRAAFAAFMVSLHHGDQGVDALASGWRGRAARLAEKHPDSLAAGYLLSMESVGAFHSGDVEQCLVKAERSRAIGELNRDQTLVAWSMHVEGLGLVKAGRVADGWARLDESMVAAATGALKPVWAGLMYCGMLVACEEYGDPRKGWQWVEQTERWLEDHPGAVLYPGVCRIHKVRLMQMRGVWPEAEIEAEAACKDLLRVHSYSAARGYYEIAEIKRLRGEYDSAQELYKKAHGLGLDPQPGLAQLRLAQGRVDAAVAGLRRALEQTEDDLLRAALLPHAVDVSLAAGDAERAGELAARLDELASRYESPWISASAHTARGAVLLSRGDVQAGLAELRRAMTAWTQLDCPYEVARVRVLYGRALIALGDEDGATLELEAARETFDRLGAAPDSRATAELLGAREAPGGLSEREVEVLRLVTQGRSNKQIAAELFISENTVARHLSNIFNKLDTPSRAAAASFAQKHGLV